MHVLLPETLAESLRALDEGGEDTKVIAGGTALMLMMRNGLIHPEELVSLERVQGLDRIGVDGDEIVVGALATLREVERSAELVAVAPTLTGATALVANHRIRARATMGGVVAESDYASDPPSVLSTMGCRVRVVGSAGERWIGIDEFLVDYYETALEHGELVTEVRMPRPPVTAHTTYIKYISRSAEDRPCIGVAAYLDTDDAGRITTLRVAIAGATATPFRVPEALADATGAKAADPGTWDAVAAAYREAIQPIEDVRGTSEYRKHVTGELVRRALATVSGGAANGATLL